MDIYASDEEKGEEIKQWWKDNGRAVVLGCVLGGAVIFSGRYWLNYQSQQSLNASQTYQEFIGALNQDNQPLAETASKKLVDEFSSTAYATFSEFEMAASAVKNNDLESAKTNLNWTMEHAKLSGHKELARLRLVQILTAEAKYEPALSLISQSESNAYLSLFTELKGDILVAQGKESDAKIAYGQAIIDLIDGEPRKQLLQLKLNDVAG